MSHRFCLRLCLCALFLLPAFDLRAADYWEQRKEAELILLKMHAAVVQLDRGFKRSHPENMASLEWVKLKLENMAIIDQLIRRVLVENVTAKPWHPAIKRAYVEFFFNFSATGEDTLGYAQRNDLYNYRQLRRMLVTSPQLTPYGWPVLSKFGADADYYAFLIAQHGQSYDRAWQEETLLPRLKRLAQRGECSRISYLWLGNPSLEFMESLPALMELEGDPWEAMVPELRRMETFFKRVPALMRAPKIPPLTIE